MGRLRRLVCIIGRRASLIIVLGTLCSSLRVAVCGTCAVRVVPAFISRCYLLLHRSVHRSVLEPVQRISSFLPCIFVLEKSSPFDTWRGGGAAYHLMTFDATGSLVLRPAILKAFGSRFSVPTQQLQLSATQAHVAVLCTE